MPNTPNWTGNWNILTSYNPYDLAFYQGSTWIALTGGAGNQPGNSPQWTLFAVAGQNAISNWRGAWASNTEYNLFDAVSYLGSSYISIIPINEGNIPSLSSSQWAVIAEAGGQGAIGSFVFRGVWNSTLTYYPNNIVTYLGSSFICINQAPIADPPTDALYWMLMASVGDQGPAGNPGPTGPTGPGFLWRGPWSALTSYHLNDVVSLLGNSYVSLTANLDVNPSTDGGTNWQIMAQAGVAGQTQPQFQVNGVNLPTPLSTLNLAQGANATLTWDGVKTITVAASGGGSVSSVFTRTGPVTAQSGDYSVGQVTGAAPLASPTFTGTVTADAIQGNASNLALSAPNGDLTLTADGTIQINDVIQINQNLQDHLGSSGTSGQLLSSTGARAQWLSQSSLAIGVGQVSGAAPLASPTFTGVVTLPAGASTPGVVMISDNQSSNQNAPIYLHNVAATQSITMTPNGFFGPQIQFSGQTAPYTVSRLTEVGAQGLYMANSGIYTNGSLGTSGQVLSTLGPAVDNGPAGLQWTNAFNATTISNVAGQDLNLTVNGQNVISLNTGFGFLTLSGVAVGPRLQLQTENAIIEIDANGSMSLSTNDSGSTLSLTGHSGLTLTAPQNQVVLTNSPATSDNSNAVATTSFVKAQVGAVQTIQVPISSAQILTLFTSPVVIIPAPGSGFFIQIMGGSIEYKHVTTPYVPAGPSNVVGIFIDGVLYTIGGMLGGVNVTGFMDQSVSMLANWLAFAGNSGQDSNLVAVSDVDNKAVVLNCDASPTGGDGTLLVNVQYVILPL